MRILCILLTISLCPWVSDRCFIRLLMVEYGVVRAVLWIVC